MRTQVLSFTRDYQSLGNGLGGAPFEQSFVLHALLVAFDYFSTLGLVLVETQALVFESFGCPAAKPLFLWS